MSGHVFLDYMSFRMTCLMRAHVLREVMLCRRKCFVVDHENTLNEERFYWTVCFIGNHLLHDGMFCRWTCLAGVHVICVDMYY